MRDIMSSTEEQIRLAYKKAQRNRCIEAMAYYATLGPVRAWASWESFKGSWAYSQWITRQSTQDAIEKEKQILSGYSFTW